MPSELKEIPKGFDPLPIEFYGKKYNIHRRAKLMLFSSVLKQHEKFNTKNIYDRYVIIKKIEQACVDYTSEKAEESNIQIIWENELFRNIYSDVCAKIIVNIDQTNSVKNPFLTEYLLSNEDIIPKLPKMTSQELFPDKHKNILMQLEMSKNVSGTIRTTNMYTCKRQGCGQKNCTIDNLYNRSLDEGVNLRITCQSCGYQWHA